MLGQGQITFKALTPNAGAPPFPANSADNGLSVDPITGRIVLGDPAPAGFGSAGQFLNNRSLQINQFSFDITDGITPHFLIDPLNQIVNLGDPAGLLGGGALVFDFINKSAVLRADNGNAMALTLDGTSTIGELGDLAGSGFGTRLRINDAARTVEIMDGAVIRMLSLDRVADRYSLGDLDLFGNGTNLYIDNPNQAAGIQSSFGDMLILQQTAGLYSIGDIGNTLNGNKIEIDDNQQQTTVKSTTKTGLFIDLNTGQYTIGDQAGGTNGTRLDILDNSISAEIQTNVGSMLLLNQNLGQYFIGDINSIANGTQIRIDDTTRGIDFFNGLGAMLSLQKNNDRYQLGDIDAVNNGGLIDLNDGTNLLNIGNTAANLGIVINGIAGFTGVVAPVNTITVNNGIVTNVA